MNLALTLTLIALLPFAIVGVYRAHMLIAFARLRRRPGEPGEPDPMARDREHPAVTLQLPVYNERFVVVRLLRAVAALEWPRDRLEIQVLDDSDDDTSSLIETELRRMPADLRVRHIRRSERAGFKAGALQHGLERSESTFIAILDADFLPPPDFLRRLVPYLDDPAMGMVQARWTFLNDEAGWLTMAQRVLLNAHFGIEHVVRQGRGLFFNFNGTAGIWRRQAILDGGGWRPDTLTEDLDLSYRSQLAGWRFRYAGVVGVPSELPEDVRSLRSQQYRWSRGMSEVATRMLPRVYRAGLPWSQRIEASAHLLSNAGYVFVMLMSLVLIPTIYHHGETLRQLWWWYPVTAVFLLTNFVVVVVFLALADATGGGGAKRAMLRALLTLPVGVALAVTGARGALQGWFSRGGEFVRTPKFNNARGTARVASRYRLPVPVDSILELALLIYHLVWLSILVRGGGWGVILPSLIFVVGYGYFVVRDFLDALQTMTAGKRRGRFRLGGLRASIPAWLRSTYTR